MKYWLEKNSLKCYNKNGCLLRIETTINNPDLPGLKFKKPACKRVQPLQAYYWYGVQCNNRYLETINDIDINSLSSGDFDKYQQIITTEKGKKVAAPDLRKKNNSS